MGEVITHKMLVGKSGRTWGAAVKNTKNSFSPLIVSVGHKVTIQKAIELVLRFSKIRVVEPVRLADKESRYLMGKFERFAGKRKNVQMDILIDEFKVN